MTSISVKGIGKSFRSYSTEWHRIIRWLGLSIKTGQENWVLRNVSFEVNKGSAIGFIGQNGAGKSTLLKIIAGTLCPTEGRVTSNGRIAAILELGMGFNPELSGRENVRHTAGLMGYSINSINQAMPEIEAFADIGSYFDEPVRTYSSGMQVRVAFSVATAWRPEILIVDEALSVGDVYFQHKSFDRIRKFQELGTTLLIVSHDRSAIQTLCDRAILLEHGYILKDGNPEEVFDYYNALIAEKEKDTISIQKNARGKAQVTSGTGEARVESIGLHNSKGEVVDSVAVGEEIELNIKVKVYKEIDSLVLGYSIKDRLGQVIYGTNTWHTKQQLLTVKANSEYIYRISFNANFGVGSYSVQTALVDRDTHLTANYEWRDLALVFSVINVDKSPFVGCVWNEPLFKIENTTNE